MNLCGNELIPTLLFVIIKNYYTLNKDFRLRIKKALFGYRHERE